MTDHTHHRKIVVPHMQLKLSGISPATAQAVADALPAAVAAEMGRGDAPADGPLSANSGAVADVTQTLAREVAARLRTGIATKEKEH